MGIRRGEETSHPVAFQKEQLLTSLRKIVAWQSLQLCWVFTSSKHIPGGLDGCLRYQNPRSWKIQIQPPFINRRTTRLSLGEQVKIGFATIFWVFIEFDSHAKWRLGFDDYKLLVAGGRGILNMRLDGRHQWSINSIIIISIQTLSILW